MAGGRSYGGWARLLNWVAQRFERESYEEVASGEKSGEGAVFPRFYR
jgi:hypothetical protein